MVKKIDWEILNTYIGNKLIEASKHPEYDIWILNYTRYTQFEQKWDEYTMACRGLVVDKDGNIIARPFQKFRNYDEYDPSEIDMSQDYEIFEKIDGSLIILFYYEQKGEWLIASRGSFISEQALEAKKMLEAKKIHNPDIFNFLDKKKTYLFEIIY